MNTPEEKQFHNFDFTTFSKAHKDMIAVSERETNGYGYGSSQKLTETQIKNIIETGSLSQQQKLSNDYFNKDGYYKQLVLHYATLLKYAGILIPLPGFGKNLSTPHIQKKYYAALEYVDKMQLPTFCTNCALKALLDGTYYGIVVGNSKKGFAVMDLPTSYCRSNLKDFEGNAIIEFDVSYFNSITDLQERKATLAQYPVEIAKGYHKYSNGKSKDRWVIVPPSVGICFPMLDGRPFFLDVIPATMQYDEAVETDLEKEKEEIKKIIVLKIPHLNDGRLLFEPEEALEMHKGAVGMVRKNGNTSVLTTYGDVDAIVSKGSTETNSNSLEKMQQNIYSKAGVSSEIFAATGGNTTNVSLQYDTAIMMYLANKMSLFVTNTLNRFFSNSNISFKYTFLPVTYHNEDKYMESSYKLASSGYSLLVPAIAQGINQRDLLAVKELENDVLKLREKLLPPETSFTQSASGEDEGGRPVIEEEDKKDQTIKNEESIEKSNTQGGSK